MLTAYSVNRYPRRAILAGLAFFSFALSPAFAADLYWDLNGVTPGSFDLPATTPQGVWDLTSSTWNSAAAGDGTGVLNAWGNTGVDVAIFAAGADAIGSYAVTVDGVGGVTRLTGITLQEGVLTLGAINGGSLDFGAAVAAINVADGSILTLNVAANGTAGLTKTGGGTLALTNAATPTGAYTVSSGVVTVADGLTLNVTTLAMGGGGAGTSSRLTLGATTVVNLGGNLSFANAGNPLAGIIEGGVINLNGNRTITVPNSTAQDADLEVRSVIADGSVNSNLTKGANGGNLLLTAANTYTGATILNGGSGTTYVQGSVGSIATSSSITINGTSTLSLGALADTAVVDRLGDTAALNLVGGTGNGTANVNYQGANLAAQAVNEERVGAVTFSGVARSIITLTPGTGDELEWTASSLTQDGTGVGLIRGTALGSAEGTADSVRFYIADGLASSTFGGAAGSGLTTAGMLPWLLGDTSAAGIGTGFVTYDATVGLRLLTASEYVSATAVASGANVNKTTTGNATVSTSARVNSWTNSATGTVVLGSGVTLGVGSGGVLFVANGTVGNAVNNGTLELAKYTQGIVHLNANAALNVTINSQITGDSGFVLSAAGTGNKTLTLAGTNTFTGGVTVLNGILQLNSASALNADGSNALNIAGGTLRLNGNSISTTALDGEGTIQNNHASIASTLRVNGGGTFSGSINDAATSGASLSLIKSGSTALILGGTNGYTGTTIVEQGTLHVSQSGANSGTNGRLTGTSSILIKQGATLQINNGNTNNTNTDRINNAATITLAGGTLNYNHSATAGVIYGEQFGSIALQAGTSQISTTQASTTGTSILNFTGLTSRATGGTLNFGGGGLGGSTRNQLFIGGVADGFIGGWATVGNEFAVYSSTTGVTALAAYEVGANSAWTSATHAKPTSDQLLIPTRDVNSLNLATGVDVTQTAGTILNIYSGGIIKQGGAVNNAGAANVSSISGGNITAGGTAAAAELFVRVTGANLTISSVIADNAGDGVTPGKVSLVKSGAGKLILNNTNTYTGDTYFNEGTLQANALNRFGANASKQLIFNGGILQFSGAFDVSAATTVFNGLATFDLQGNNILLAQSIGGGGSGSFVKSGTGTLSVQATTNGLNYTGSTTLTSGTLAFTATAATHTVQALNFSGALATDAVSVNIGTGNVLNLGGNVSYSAANSPLGSAIQNGTLNLNGTRTFQVGDSTNAAVDLSVSSVIADGSVATSGMVKSDAGTLTLSGANTFTGKVEVQDGTLRFDCVSPLGGGASSLGAATDASAGSILLGKAATTGTLEYTGTGHTTNRNFELNGETGGGAILSNGTGALSLAGSVSITQEGTKTFTLGGTASSNIVNGLSGVISDDASVRAQVNLVKQGSSTWQLNGNNTYQGTTTVNGGVLAIGQGGTGVSAAQAATVGSTGTGLTSVASGAALSGTGLVKGGLVLSGVLSPGDTTSSYGDQLGTLFVQGNVTIETGSILQLQVRTASFNVADLAGDTTASTFTDALAALTLLHASDLALAVGTGQHDHLDISGNLDWGLGTSLNVNVALAAGYQISAGDVFNLIDWASVSNTPDFNIPTELNVQDLGLGLVWDTRLFASDGIIIAVQAVPEPSRALFLLVGIFVVAFRRCRIR